MKSGEDNRGARGGGPRKLGLCVLCGLPAAGKSTFARALSHQLQQQLGWAVGVVAYDDVLPDVFLKEASAGPLPPQWKSLRQELLKYLEYFLLAVLNGCQMSAPSNRTEAMWEGFITCLKDQNLISPAAPEAQSCYLLTKTAVSGPLFLILDDNFYYQSMRYEVYQLARKHSTGFCQLFLDCPLETCLQRNGRRRRPLPAETIRLMGRKIEEPNPERNAWEHSSLTIQSSACSSEARYPTGSRSRPFPELATAQVARTRSCCLSSRICVVTLTFSVWDRAPSGRDPSPRPVKAAWVQHNPSSPRWVCPGSQASSGESPVLHA
ncbi:L-seryl-tRNA(Sec) kinase-like [Rhynchonycteris naso]